MVGIDLLHFAREEVPETPVIVLTAHVTVETVVEAFKLSAFDDLEKPISGIEEWQEMVARAVERKQLLALY